MHVQRHFSLHVNVVMSVERGQYFSLCMLAAPARFTEPFSMLLKMQCSWDQGHQVCRVTGLKVLSPRSFSWHAKCQWQRCKASAWRAFGVFDVELLGLACIERMCQACHQIDTLSILTIRCWLLSRHACAGPETIGSS